MDVLLSIKPKYANKIIEGEKTYEFRKIRLDKQKIGYVYIYSTSPVKKIVARIAIGEIIEDSPERLWRRCKKHSGVTKEEFFSYYAEKDVAFAIPIKKVEPLETPIDPYAKIANFTPPQSYYYLKDNSLL
jgi:type I restriction enzyme S subunit